MTWSPASVDVKVAVVTPFALVAAGVLTVLPPPVTEIETEAPGIGVFASSRAVTVTVEGPPPAGICPGDAPTFDWPALTGPGVTVTTGLSVRSTPPTLAVIVCGPTLVEEYEPVATPLASVAPGCP